MRIPWEPRVFTVESPYVSVLAKCRAERVPYGYFCLDDLLF